MKRESLLKVYEGNKTIVSHRPLMVLTAENVEKGDPFSEHFIFSDIAEKPLIHGRTSFEPAPHTGVLDFGKYPDLFSADALLRFEFGSARDRFEHTVHQANRELHKELFWSGRLFEFSETDDASIVRWKLFGMFTEQLATMFDFTQNRNLRALEDKLRLLPKLKIRKTPG